MKKRNDKDKYACFQWIRDVRAEMTRDMEGMTPEECSEYINERYEKARVGRPRYTLKESREMLVKYLAEPETPRAGKTKSAAKPPERRRAARRPVHA